MIDKACIYVNSNDADLILVNCFSSCLGKNGLLIWPVYQMSTKKRCQMAAAQGIGKPAEWRRVYQMSTNFTFLHPKRRFSPLFLFFPQFLQLCKGRDTGLTGVKSNKTSKSLGKTEKNISKMLNLRTTISETSLPVFSQHGPSHGRKIL